MCPGRKEAATDHGGPNLGSFLEHWGWGGEEHGPGPFQGQDSKPTQVVEQLLSSVLAGPQMEKVWVFINKLGVHSAVEELIITEHVLQERDVGLKGKEEQREALGEAEERQQGWLGFCIPRQREEALLN